ncbi:hypothetical protein [Sphingosinicella sp. BN140058]|uniref:hypothetical protein n=1 Tax=Sphingosinicella sp. BN140058 TaxID=1892855 RepID=UPI001011012F|nr:hypothetical protein [Sphingosinicella sp. BN140058]QAY75726.1 hypothetical protein ETR14_03675 [Sphingosinicella sp. BN140058]
MVTMLDDLSSQEINRSPLAERLGAGFNRLIEASLLWVMIGATSGALVLTPSLTAGEGPSLPSPSAAEIERAVAQAEAEGIAAGAEIRRSAVR